MRRHLETCEPRLKMHDLVEKLRSSRIFSHKIACYVVASGIRT